MENKYFCVVILFFGLCHRVSKASECTARGRFPNDETDDCRGYTMCLMGLTNFTQYKLTCPIGSIYSHLEEQCTKATNYKCYPTFNCTSVGNYPDPEITDCSSFVACIEDLGGRIGTARSVGCPPDMLFNSTAGVCVNSTEFTCAAEPKQSMDPAVEVQDVVHESNNAVIASVQFPVIISIGLLKIML